MLGITLTQNGNMLDQPFCERGEYPALQDDICWLSLDSDIAFEGGVDTSASSMGSCFKKTSPAANLPQQALFAVFGLTFGSPSSFTPTPIQIVGEKAIIKTDEETGKDTITGYEWVILNNYDYDAFGVERRGGILPPADDDPNPFRYCGEYWDAETDSYYLRARYYAPRLGRFITEDPARPGAPELNWYTYCANNPIAYIDPSGLSAEKYWGRKTEPPPDFPVPPPYLPKWKTREEIGTGYLRMLSSSQFAKSGLSQIPDYLPVGVPLKRSESNYFIPLTGFFGDRGGAHTGIDLTAPYGTIIYATHDGVVSTFNYGSTSYGLGLTIASDSPYKTLYGHMSGYLVSNEATVKRGDPIGYVGNTGHSEGNHLHYEVIFNGKKVNPAVSMVLPNILGLPTGAVDNRLAELSIIKIFLEQAADASKKKR